jgi:hypothetical protein
LRATARIASDSRLHASATGNRDAVSGLALQLPFLKVSESMGNHDSKIVDAYGVD